MPGGLVFHVHLGGDIHQTKLFPLLSVHSLVDRHKHGHSDCSTVTEPHTQQVTMHCFVTVALLWN